MYNYSGVKSILQRRLQYIIINIKNLTCKETNIFIDFN